MEELTFQTWGEMILGSLKSVWFSVVAYLPELLGAIAVFFIGMIVAAFFSRLTKKILAYTKVDKMNEKYGVKEELESMGLHFTFINLIASIVKWFFVIVTLITVVDILNIPQLSLFLEDVALYFPNILVALIIILIGLIAGRFVQDISTKALKSSYVPDRSIGVMTSVIKWSIFIFALMAAMVQLGVAASLIQILFTGVVIMFALAGGLAFGLAGREKAAKIIDRIEREFGRKKEGE